MEELKEPLSEKYTEPQDGQWIPKRVYCCHCIRNSYKLKSLLLVDASSAIKNVFFVVMYGCHQAHQQKDGKHGLRWEEIWGWGYLSQFLSESSPEKNWLHST